MKRELCGQQGRLVRGQLASSVRGRWNSAGTSGREQRGYWDRGAKGAQREEGQGKGGGQDPVVLTHSSDRQSYLGDLVWRAVLSDLGEGEATLKVHGGGGGGSSPLASLS